MKLVYSILDKTRKLEGKTLIISPKIETVDIVANKVQEYIGEEVGRVYSKNTTEQNKEALSKNIISSTIKSVGEGVDIKGLRILINLEPVASKALADQVRGRLREYSKEDDTYFFYPVDTTLPEVFNMLKRILPVMKRKCKEIIYYH
jgi:superfamily II DNA or RNA helicase